MTRFVIRDAVAADMPVLRQIYRRASLWNESDRVNLLAHPEALELSDLAVTEGRTRTAVADGRVIGFASWLSAETVFEVEDMFVDPDWMGQGAGRALMLDLIALARGRGARRLEVTAGNAAGFYQKAGFVVGHDTQTTFGPAFRMYLET